MKDQRDRTFVREYFFSRVGLELQDFEGTGQKNPDFQVQLGEGLSLIVELKTLKKRNLWQDKNAYQFDDEYGVQAIRRPDNGPARVARRIDRAHKQLREFQHPWAIVLLNEDPLLDCQDFRAVFTGFVEYSNRIQLFTETSAGRVANGMTKDLRYSIDLYLWIDRPAGNRLTVYWSTPKGNELALHFKEIAGVPWEPVIE